MWGWLAIVVVLCVVIPVGVLMSGAVASAILSYFLKDNAEKTHPDSELIELNT